MTDRIDKTNRFEVEALKRIEATAEIQRRENAASTRVGEKYHELQQRRIKDIFNIEGLIWENRNGDFLSDRESFVPIEKYPKRPLKYNKEGDITVASQTPKPQGLLRFCD